MPCCIHYDAERTAYRYRRIVWAALVINGGMFLIEIIADLIAGSVSLQADALDFLGDVVNYGISLFIIARVLRYRATAALIKGLTVGLFGVWVVGATVWHAVQQTVPQPVTMGKVGLAALVGQSSCLYVVVGSSNWRQQHAFSLALLA